MLLVIILSKKPAMPHCHEMHEHTNSAQNGYFISETKIQLRTHTFANLDSGKVLAQSATIQQ